MSPAAQPVLFGSTGEKDFHRLTSSRYSTMVKRFAEKRSRKNPSRIIRHGRIVPFTLKEYQAWVLKQLGGKPDGVGRCFYSDYPFLQGHDCEQWIDLKSMVGDHVEPVSLGGSLSLDNYVGCCKACNDFKSKLPANDFRALREALKQLSPYGQREVVSRLRKSVALAAGTWAKKQAAPQQEIDDDDF